MRLPTQADVLGYMQSLSNWGRWGPDDELGTLNFVTPERTAVAARLVTSGLSIGCARPISPEDSSADVSHGVQRRFLRSGEAPSSSVADADTHTASASEFFGVVAHGFGITHVDALSHIFWDGAMYNGRPSGEVRDDSGARALSIEAMRDGCLTRGVMFDVARHRGVDWLEPGDAIHPDELESIERATGAVVGEGDALIIRTGWTARRAARGVDSNAPRHRPGLHAACLPWLRERSVAIVAADAPNDVEPSGYPGIRMPLHAVGIVAMGLCLIDNCDFEQLAGVCDRDGRHEFLFVVAPSRYVGGTGSPLTPLAVF